jgi:cytochrome c nitrite reductase small subunit
VVPGSVALAALAVSVLGGAALGLGAYTFVYARGGSYLSDDPRACANCHVMQAQLDAWSRSSHHQVAVCNDCHTPKDPVGKYWTKALNGWHHSRAFTTGDFHEPIMIKATNHAVTEGRCRSCHAAVVDAIDHAPRGGQALSCTRCHADVGHLH